MNLPVFLRTALLLTLVAAPLSGCADQGEPFVPSPILLTAQEVGGGEAILLDDAKIPSALPCHADPADLFSRSRIPSDSVAYVDGGRVVAIGMHTDDLKYQRYALEDARNIAHKNPCNLNLPDEPVAFGIESEEYLKVKYFDFGDDVYAFQTLSWETKTKPTSFTPKLGEDEYVYASARAYGIVDDTYVFVQINLENTSTTPPTEEELRALWDAQVAKLRYYKASEHATDLLTPQSGH